MRMLATSGLDRLNQTAVYDGLMTEEEIKADADRALVRYARNEKVIDCLLGRFSSASQAFAALGKAADSGAADAECSHAMETINGYDFSGDLGRLRACLQGREELERQMINHGYAHMIRRER